MQIPNTFLNVTQNLTVHRRTLAKYYTTGFSPTVRWSVTSIIFAVFLLTCSLYGVAFAFSNVFPYFAASNVRSIVFERTSCYGFCPSYQLIFLADGRARYEGRAFVRDRGVYDAQFDRRAFSRFANELARRGMFVSRSPNVSIIDAPTTSILIRFTNGTTATNTAYIGLPSDELDDDMYTSSFFIDGFAGHICGWHQTSKLALPVHEWPGYYSPISTAPCRKRGH